MKNSKKLVKKIISVFLAFTFILAWPLANVGEVWAGSQGPNSAAASGNCVNATGIGTVAWTSAGNAFSSNDTYATASVDGTTTNYIKCTNFGFSIPSNAVVKGIVVGVERKSNSTANGGSNDAAMRIVKGGVIGATDRSTATTYTISDVYEDHGGAADLWGETLVPTDINASTFGAAIAAIKASAAGAAHTVSVDHVRITVYYSIPPAAPTQDAPINGATGVSIRPTFTMTATDSDSDNLGYKVTIYSDSGCTAVVQTNDQAVSSTGWTGTNASCTAAPTSCYTSGTQGSFLTQTALSSNTQYWWKASAKDPDGAVVFTDSSTCNSFTTAVAVSSFTQNKYLWYVDNDLADPAAIWGTPDLTENQAITVIPAGKDPPDASQELRLRVNMVVNTADLPISSNYFKLEFKAGTDGSCTTGSWSDVGTGAWTYATSTVIDGSDISALLSDTTVGKGEEYAKSKPTALNHVAASIGNIIEYDFHIIGSSSTPNTTYSFRVVGTNSSGSTETVFDGYTNCPTLTVEPGPSNLMRHGNVFSNGSEQGFFWAN